MSLASKTSIQKLLSKRKERPLLMAATRLRYPVNTFTLSPSFSPDVQDSRHWTPYRSEPHFSDQKLKLRLEMRKIQSSDALVLGSSQENSSASGGSMCSGCVRHVRGLYPSASILVWIFGFRYVL